MDSNSNRQEPNKLLKSIILLYKWYNRQQNNNNRDNKNNKNNRKDKLKEKDKQRDKLKDKDKNKKKIKEVNMRNNYNHSPKNKVKVDILQLTSKNQNESKTPLHHNYLLINNYHQKN